MPDFHTDIEGEKIWDEAVFGDFEFDDLRGKAEAVEEAENEGCCLGVGLESEPPLEGTEIVQGLVDDRQTDDRIDEIGVGGDTRQDTEKQRGRMADREQRHVDSDVLQPVEEEDDAEKKEQVIVSGHHVFRAEIDEGQDQRSAALLDVTLVPLGDIVRPRFGTRGEEDQQNCSERENAHD